MLYFLSLFEKVDWKLDHQTVPVSPSVKTTPNCGTELVRTRYDRPYTEICSVVLLVISTLLTATLFKSQVTLHLQDYTPSRLTDFHKVLYISTSLVFYELFNVLCKINLIPFTFRATLLTGLNGV